MCHVFAQWLYIIGINQSIENIQGENLLKSYHDKYYSYMIPLSENMVRALRNIEALMAVILQHIMKVLIHVKRSYLHFPLYLRSNDEVSVQTNSFSMKSNDMFWLIKFVDLIDN